MLTIKVANTGESSVTVDGLGVLSPGEVLMVGEDGQKAFIATRGLSLAQARIPQGVGVTVILDSGKDGEEVK